MYPSWQKAMADRNRLERFLVETLGHGLHVLPGLLSGSPPVAVQIEKYGVDPEYGILYDLEILPTDISDGIPLEFIAKHVASTHKIAAKFRLRDATDDEYQSLKESIARHGLRHPIHLDAQGRIIDGRLRQRACDELGINCPSVVIGKIDPQEMQQLSLELDLCRKHLKSSDRKQLAQKRLWEAAWTSDRQIGRETGLDHKTVASIRSQMVGRGEIPQVQERAGKDGKRYKFPTALAKSSKEIKQAQKLYQELGNDTPLRDIDLRQSKRMLRSHRRKKAGETLQVQPEESDIRLVHQDFRTLDLCDNSVDVIFTDPPYVKQFVPIYGDLAKFAARVLKPGGLLLAYTGVMFLDQVMRHLGTHLEFHWQHILIHTNCDQLVATRKVFSGYKPILCYSKGLSTPLDCVRDVFHGTGAQKDLHEWQQSIDEPLYLLSRLTKPGDLIVDCFGGAFTTAEAVLRLGGRRFISCDIDPGCVALGQDRLAKVRLELANPCHDHEKKGAGE